MRKVVGEDGMLGETQNGFRKGRGISDNLFILTSLINNRQKKFGSLCTHVCFTDLKKTFMG